MLANVLLPMTTTTVRSDRRARSFSRRRRTCPAVTTSALFTKGNNPNPSGNPDTTQKKGDDFHAWTREDQRSTRFDDDLIIDARAKSKYGGHGGASVDGWTKYDQRPSLRNEAIRENLTYAEGKGNDKTPPTPKKKSHETKKNYALWPESQRPSPRESS